MNPDSRTDLRRLRLRYGDKMAQAFHTTVAEGRPSNGMPSRKATLSRETIEKILTRLESVQKEP